MTLKLFNESWNNFLHWGIYWFTLGTTLNPREISIPLSFIMLAFRVNTHAFSWHKSKNMGISSCVLWQGKIILQLCKYLAHLHYETPCKCTKSNPGFEYGNEINYFTKMTKISSSPNFISLLQILQQSTFYLKLVRAETKRKHCDDANCKRKWWKLSWDIL